MDALFNVIFNQGKSLEQLLSSKVQAALEQDAKDLEEELLGCNIHKNGTCKAVFDRMMGEAKQVFLKFGKIPYEQ